MKKYFKITLIMTLIAAAFTGISTAAQNEASPRLGKVSIGKIIAAMTLEEKAALVVGEGMTIPGSLDGSSNDPKKTGKDDTLVSGAAGSSYSVPRLGITPMVFADGPAGLRINPTREKDANTYYCTAFPVATLLASTWDRDIVFKVGEAIGDEVHEYGVDFLLAPALNLHRNPLAGRNFEYYSEDPLVTGKITAAMVNGIQSQGVGATIKHFAANNAETNRMALDTYVSERALRELYLEGFRIAVQESQPWAVMSSYNKINGTYTSESHDLLTKVLRDDWGFKGFVMTDWMGGSDPVAQMKAGNDLLMPGNTSQTEAIIKAVKEGRLEEKVLDKNVERILNIQIQSPRFKGFKYSNKPKLKEHAEIARKAAMEGMVLLKNSNKALPLVSGIKKLAVFGNTSYDIITGGTGSGDVNEAYSVSLVDGLNNAGYSIDQAMLKKYESYIKDEKKKLPKADMFAPPQSIPELEISPSYAAAMETISDCAIITIGRNSGEGSDRSSGDGDFNLTKNEKALITNVSDAFHQAGKKCIVILNVGGVVETASWRNAPDAILLAWQGGQETGNCIADIISGKVNPSGKLATTFPMKYEDVPSSKNFPGVVLKTATQEEEKKATATPGPPPSKPSEIIYQEGIYVGYRYYDSFNIVPAYEFGFGLSYTGFEYKNLKISSDIFRDKIKVAVDVRNSGDTAGRETVQMYIKAPSVKIEKPEKELKGFAKTRLLKPGETQTIEFEIDSRNLASFDTASSSWIAEKGKYKVLIGASSRDIRQEASFDLEKDIKVKTDSKALTLTRNIDELKRNK
jgi:beta-glucosidase